MDKARSRWSPHAAARVDPPRPLLRLRSLGRHLLGQEAPGLACPKVGVEPAVADQPLVRALFDDAAAVHDHQPVHGGDRGEAVGNGDHRLAGHQVIELLLDRLLHLRVQGAGGLVEDKDRRVLQQHAGDGDALALTPGKLHAPFTNVCRVALATLQVLKPSDELVGLRLFGGGDGRCFARPRPTVENVVTDGAVQQGGVLCHHTDLRPEAVLGDVRDILAIDQDAAGFEVVEAQQQVDQCRFARAGAANQSHLLTGPDPQGEVMDHAAASTRADLCGATVVKAHVLKADFTGAHYERPAVEPVNDKIWATDGLNALLHDANVFEDAGDYP